MDFAQNFLLYTIPIFICAIFLEAYYFRNRGYTSYMILDTVNSISIAFLFFISLMWYDPLQSSIANIFFEFRQIDFSVSLTLLFVCLILDDLCYYVNHIFFHKTRWGWAVHIVHHSGPRLNLLTSARLSPLQFLAPTIISRIPLLLLGFSPQIIFLCMSIGLFYQFFIHTEIPLKFPRWYEYVFNTPRHHQIHHSKNETHTDKNFGSILIIWDRIFGTFQDNDGKSPIEYGAIGIDPQRGIGHVIFGEFRRIFRRSFVS
jgi:sterol desaturase/sphingolipid hydroxylase (fatty acid hydroxylase superfamily)